MHVTIHTGALQDKVASISNEAAETVRMGFNPSALPAVDELKALAAAFITACDNVVLASPSNSARFAAVAKTNMETAVMWAVKAATPDK